MMTKIALEYADIRLHALLLSRVQKYCSLFVAFHIQFQ